MNTSKQLQTGKRPWRLLSGLVITLVVLIGFKLYSIISEEGFLGLLSLFPHAATQSTQSTVRLLEQPVYKIKKKQEVLGVSVLRIVSKQQPEEFLVLEGVSRPLVDKIYGKKPDLVWANLMANQLLKLRQSGDTSSPITVDVQGVKTLNAGFIQQKKQQFPYWQLEVKFKLSNENAPRAYQAAVVRNIHPAQTAGEKDTLVVAYAQKEAFQKSLVSDLMTHLSFEQN